MIEVSGIEYCATHGGIMTEGTDYHIDGLGCEYAELESDDPCRPVPLYYTPENVECQTCGGVKRLTYNGYDYLCPACTPPTMRRSRERT